MRWSSLTLVALVTLAAPAAAQDTGGPAKPPENPPAEKPADKGAGDKTGKAEGKSEDKKDAPRLEHARKLVTELEFAVEAAKTAKPSDPLLVKSLEHALEEARKLAQPIRLADLTDEEKKALTDELKKQLEDKKGPPGAQPPTNPADEMAKGIAERAFEGVDVTEEEHLKASKIINDWWEKAWPASRSGDSKKVSDLKNDRNAALEKELGKKKAQKVINNLNGMANWGGKR